MSRLTKSNEKVDWENVGRRIFYDCLASSSPTYSLSSSSSLPSTRSKVTIKILIDYVRNNAPSDLRNGYVLAELQNSIEELSRDGQVDYMTFKKAAKRWITRIQSYRHEDGNNNLPKSGASDDLLQKSDNEKYNSTEFSDSENRDSGLLEDKSGTTKTSRGFVKVDFVDLLNVSSYSPGSESTRGSAMSDSMPESNDDMDSGCGVVPANCSDLSQIDLRIRLRQSDLENSVLRQDLVRAEELASELQEQLETFRHKLECTKEKYRQLERENDEHREILNEAKQKERDCRWALHKAEKQRLFLTKKLEEAEMDKQQVALLNSQLEKCKKEKYDLMRELTVCQRELEEKQKERDVLSEELAQLTEVHLNLQESYDKTIKCLRAKLQEIKNEKSVLYTADSFSSPTERSCSTPPITFLSSLKQSTPHNNAENPTMQDSLYDELKASGFSQVNDSRVCDLENQLSLYDEEIHHAVCQIDKVLEQVASCKSYWASIHRVPDLDPNKSSDAKNSEISLLAQKIEELTNMANEIILRPKAKDAGWQLSAEPVFTSERLFTQFGIRSFKDHFDFVREKSERGIDENQQSGCEQDVFIQAFSMNSRLLGEYVNEVETASDDRKNFHHENFPSDHRLIQEHSIIDPIVEELDKILKCTSKCEEESKLDNSATSKKPRSRCIYTGVQPAQDSTKIDDTSKISPFTGSASGQYRPLAQTYVISSGGDGLFSTMENSAEKKKFSNFSESENAISSLSTENPENSTNGKLSYDERREKKSTNPADDVKKSNFPDASKIDGNAREIFSNGHSMSYCVTPAANFRVVPKRKISVFHRSFDIDTCGNSMDIGSDSYRLVERSMSDSDGRDKNSAINADESDPEFMKMSPNTRKFLLNYRSKGNDSDSSDSQSPTKLVDGICDDTSITTEPEVPNRISRSMNLAPAKLRFTSSMETSQYSNNFKRTPDSTKDEDSNSPRENNNSESVSEHQILEQQILGQDTSVQKNPSEFDIEEILTITESSIEEIRPGEEIERGITYRKWYREPVSRKNETKSDDIPVVVLSSDGESTSCDSTSKKELPAAQSTMEYPLVSTYGKPQFDNQTYTQKVETSGYSMVLWAAGSSFFGVESQEVDSPSEKRTRTGNIVGFRLSPLDIASSTVVELAMSSGEESSDSECDPMAIRDNNNRNDFHKNAGDSNNNNNHNNHNHPSSNIIAGIETRDTIPEVRKFTDNRGAFLSSSTPLSSIVTNNNTNNNCNSDNNHNSNYEHLAVIDCTTIKSQMAQKRDKRKKLQTLRRSVSESGFYKTEFQCQLTNGETSKEGSNTEESRPVVFPSLTDTRLQESGIAKLSNADENGGNMAEAELERKYVALSIGLGTDRVTLPRRVGLSIRQRDQSEKNLVCEVQKMQRDIQDLAPLCIDRESVERVERVRHQLDMIAQCAHRVSCTAETLGAVHQENRISRAILLADRYLIVLRSRCEKLALDLAETKRILTENHIVIEEHSGELGDDATRIRYRELPTNNRTMMARRRASIATIFRPLGNFQDITKDGLRQRNSVSGRVTVRRPSLSAESQKWEAEKLDRTDSSSSIGELREIFELAETRRHSREEISNTSFLHSSNLSIRDCDNSEAEIWSSPRDEPLTIPEVNVDELPESRVGRMRSSMHTWQSSNHVPWRAMLWCIIIAFFFGFYVNRAVSSPSACSGAHWKWWSIEEILARFLPWNSAGPTPL